MKKQVRKKKLNLPRGRRGLLMRNLVTSLVLNEKIKTTVAKAKALQPMVEKLIHDAKNPDKVAAIRKVNTIMTTELAAKKMIEDLPKRFQDRTGGYTRITKIGYRAGDAAPLVQIELTA